MYCRYLDGADHCTPEPQMPPHPGPRVSSVQGRLALLSTLCTTGVAQAFPLRLERRSSECLITPFQVATRTRGAARRRGRGGAGGRGTPGPAERPVGPSLEMNSIVQLAPDVGNGGSEDGGTRRPAADLHTQCRASASATTLQQRRTHAGYPALTTPGRESTGMVLRQLPRTNTLSPRIHAHARRLSSPRGTASPIRSER